MEGKKEEKRKKITLERPLQRSKLAVALRYNREKDRAPVVTASGKGRFAEKILAVAREHGVPVKSNPALALTLGKLSPGEEIPPELYEAVAVLLAYVLEIDERNADPSSS